MRLLPYCLLLSLCLVGLLTAGSVGRNSGKTATVPVQGKVTFAGRPLLSGEVEFRSGDGFAASGRIEPDGTYQLTTFEPRDGAVPGVYRVAIKPLRRCSGGTLEAIPSHYADLENSGLQFEISAAGGRIDIDLLDDGSLAQAPMRP